MVKRYGLVGALLLLGVGAHFRYELLWTSPLGIALLRENWSSLYRPGWAKTHGLVAKLLPQPEAETIVVGSSHLKRLIPRSWAFAQDQSLRFYAQTTNFAFQLYLERDSLLALNPKHVIVSFLAEEFKFSFHDELPYLHRPLRYSDIVDVRRVLATAIGSGDEATLRAIEHLERWLWKSLFLRTTAFDLAASFTLTNSIRTLAPRLAPTDDLRSHLQRQRTAAAPSTESQLELSLLFLQELSRELRKRGVTLTVVEGLWNPRCRKEPYRTNTQLWRAQLHRLGQRTDMRFVPASELPAPAEDLFEDCVHVRVAGEAALEFRESYLREFLWKVPQR